MARRYSINMLLMMLAVVMLAASSSPYFASATVSPADPRHPPGVVCPAKAQVNEVFLYANSTIGSIQASTPSVWLQGDVVLSTYVLNGRNSMLRVSRDKGATFSDEFLIDNGTSSYLWSQAATDGKNGFLLVEAPVGTETVIFSRRIDLSSGKVSSVESQKVAVPLVTGGGMSLITKPGAAILVYTGFGSGMVIKSLDLTLPDSSWIVRYDENVAWPTFVTLSGGFQAATDGLSVLVCGVAGNVTCVRSVDGIEPYDLLAYTGGSSIVPLTQTARLTLAAVSTDEYIMALPTADGIVTSFFTSDSGATWTRLNAVIPNNLLSVRDPFSLIGYSKNLKAELPDTDPFKTSAASFVYRLQNDSFVYATTLKNISGVYSWTPRVKHAINTTFEVAVSGPSSLRTADGSVIAGASSLINAMRIITCATIYESSAATIHASWMAVAALAVTVSSLVVF